MQVSISAHLRLPPMLLLLSCLYQLHEKFHGAISSPQDVPKSYRNCVYFQLFRDFRATLYSQAAAFETFNMTTDGEKRAKVMCATMESEAKELKVLARRFPGRIQLIRYEDGCVRPLDYARSIYTFAGLRFGQATEMYIKGITRSKKSQKVVSDKFKVERSDAIQTMNKWRRSATFEFVQKMDVFCGAADEIFGYKPARTISQLKTMQFSLVKNPKLPKGLYQPLLIT